MQEIRKRISLENAAAVAIIAFVAECTFGCSGRWLSVGPLSIRMILFVVTLLLTLPIVIKNFKTIIKNPKMIVLMIFGFLVLFSAVIGIRNHNKTAFVWNDLSSFLTFALFPGFFLVAQKKKMIMHIVNAIFWSSVFVAVVATVIHYSLPFLSGDQIMALNDWINNRSLGGLALLNSGSFRIYFRAEIFLQVAILFGVWKIKTAKPSNKIWLYLSEAFLTFAWLVSYTRGFWLGLAVTVIVFLLFEPGLWKQCIISAGVTLVLVIGFLGISWACYGQPAGMTEAMNRVNISRTYQDREDTTQTDVANKNAAELRSHSLVMLKEKIIKHPLVGNGLGANLDGIRNDGKTEYMYLDLLMKLGLVGFAFYLLVSFGFLPSFIKKLKEDRNSHSDEKTNSNRVYSSMLVAAFIGVAVTSMVNPFLSTPMGIMLLMSVYVSVCGE